MLTSRGRRFPRHSDCGAHGPLTADVVLSMTFTCRKLVPGYDIDEVDDFLDHIAASMTGFAPPITALDIREHVFERDMVRGGFNPEEVDDFLECIAQTLEGRAGYYFISGQIPISGEIQVLAQIEEYAPVAIAGQLPAAPHLPVAGHLGHMPPPHFEVYEMSPDEGAYARSYDGSHSHSAATSHHHR